MTDWPRVTIALLTYEDGARHTAERTLRAALDRITYAGPLSVHIADDGSVDGHVDRLREIAGGYATVEFIGASNAGRRGYGHSFNLMTQVVHLGSDVVLVLEDDWELTRPLDLAPLVETLLAQSLPYGGPAISCIRLGYLGFTQSLRGEFVHTQAGVMVMLDPDSQEPHIFAGHPRLETVAFERAVGPWPEGLAPGATEFTVCHIPEARRGVAWPLDFGPSAQRADSLFVHIGGHGLGEVEPVRD